MFVYCSYRVRQGAEPSRIEEAIMTTYYMHKESGDVATEQEWRDDYENMDVESWFGKSVDGITNEDTENWAEGGHLIEVVKDADGEWVEA